MSKREQFSVHKRDDRKVWRILRPLTRGIRPCELERLRDHHTTLISIVDNWCQVMEPGDRVEIGDSQDMSIWLYGELISCKKVRIKDISIWVLENALLRHSYPVDFDVVPTVDDISSLLSEFYQEPITVDTVVVVEDIYIDRVDPPNYSLQLN